MVGVSRGEGGMANSHEMRQEIDGKHAWRDESECHTLRVTLRHDSRECLFICLIVCSGKNYIKYIKYMKKYIPKPREKQRRRWDDEKSVSEFAIRYCLSFATLLPLPIPLPTSLRFGPLFVCICS